MQGRAQAEAQQLALKTKPSAESKQAKKESTKKELRVGNQVKIAERRGLKYRGQTGVITDFTACHAILKLDTTGKEVYKWKDNVKKYKPAK